MRTQSHAQVRGSNAVEQIGPPLVAHTQATNTARGMAAVTRRAQRGPAHDPIAPLPGRSLLRTRNQLPVGVDAIPADDRDAFHRSALRCHLGPHHHRR